MWYPMGGREREMEDLVVNSPGSAASQGALEDVSLPFSLLSQVLGPNYPQRQDTIPILYWLLSSKQASVCLQASLPPYPTVQL